MVGGVSSGQTNRGSEKMGHDWFCEPRHLADLRDEELEFIVSFCLLMLVYPVFLVPMFCFKLQDWWNRRKNA